MGDALDNGAPRNEEPGSHWQEHQDGSRRDGSGFSLGAGEWGILIQESDLGPSNFTFFSEVHSEWITVSVLRNCEDTEIFVRLELEMISGYYTKSTGS